MGITSGVMAVIGTAYSVYEGEQAASAQKKARKEQRSIKRAQAMREQKQQIRQARMARAQAVNQAYTSGGQGSPLSGAESSIGSQMGANLGFSEFVSQRSSAAAGFQQDAADSMFRSNIGGQVAGFASNFASFGGGNQSNPRSQARNMFLDRHVAVQPGNLRR